MPTRTTTDNFLPYVRSKTYHQTRPILYTPRRDYTYQGHNRQTLISDFLPSRISLPEPQLALTGPGASAQPVAIFGRQFAPSLSLKTLVYTMAATVFVLGVTASLMSFKADRQQTGQVKSHQTTAVVNPSAQNQASFGLPTRLKIPKININAAFEHVGLTPQGTMDAPKDPANAGWYGQGPRPGEEGSSVIAGHFGWVNRTPAIFDNLDKLQKGDKLYVEDAQGKIITFVVREFQTYGPNEKVPSVFSSSDGKAHLNLITCGGDWNKNQKSYSSRLVVFADKETG